MVRQQVVYLDHCAQMSGAELALARLVPALDAVDATVVLAEHGPLVAELRTAGIAVEIRPLAEHSRALRRDAVVPGAAALKASGATVAYAVRLALLLHRRRPDLVVTNSLKAALYGGFAGRLAGVPVVWHLHDRIAEDYLPKPAVTAIRAAARILPRAVIANSETTLKAIGLDRRVRRPLAEVIGNVCPLVDRPPAVAESRAAEPTLVVGMVGRLAPWKGQDVFLQAFAKAFGDGGRTERAVVVGSALFGEDDYAASLHRLAAELGIAARVDFTGFADDPWTEMARFDVLVHASVVPEPFGQVVVEGMALGCCVVATGVGGPAEIITDGVDGLLTEPGDVAELAATLSRLDRDVDLRHRLATAGPPAVRQFGAAAIARQEQAFYRSVAQASRPRRLRRRAR